MQDYIFRFAPLVLEELGALILQGSDEGVMFQPHPAVLAAYKQVTCSSLKAGACFDCFLRTRSGIFGFLPGTLHTDICAHIARVMSLIDLCLQTDDFLIARLALPAGVASTFRDNDAILLSKDDPNVRQLHYH